MCPAGPNGHGQAWETLLARFVVERCGYRPKETTVRVVDGEPGAELQVDFGHRATWSTPRTVGAGRFTR